MKPSETMEKYIYLIAQSAGLVPVLEMPSLLQGYSGNPVQDSQHPWQLLRNQYQCQAGIQRRKLQRYQNDLMVGSERNKNTYKP